MISAHFQIVIEYFLIAESTNKESLFVQNEGCL